MTDTTQTSSTTTGSGGSSAGTGGQAGQVAQAAAAGAKDLAQETRRTAGDLVGMTKDELRTLTEQRAGQVGAGLRELGKQLTAVGDGRPADGMVADLGHQAGARIEALADRIEHGGLDAMATEVRTFARRRPGAFLAGAAITGFVTARILRDTSAVTGSTGSSGMIGGADGAQPPVGSGTPSTVDVRAAATPGDAMILDEPVPLLPDGTAAGMPPPPSPSPAETGVQP